MGERIQVHGVQAEFAEFRRGAVDGEVIARIHGGGGDQRQHADQGFGHHGAIADEASVGLLVEHLRRGP